jgi:hypothetical protein
MHNIHYITCDENANRKGIMADIAEHAREDGDGYSSRFTWHDNIPPYESYEKAEEAIKMLDRGFYDDHAVRFYDYSKAEKTAKMAEYEAKVIELWEGKKKYAQEHSVHTFQAKFIGCPKCESKLNKQYFRGNNCPLCQTSLLSKTTLDKLKWYDEKIADYRNRIEEEKRKQKKKAVIKWLIKYEYHS